MSSEREIPLADFYEQLSLLLKAKLPLPECLAQLSSATRDAQFANALKAISTATTSGEPLADAMARHPQLFRPQDVALIRDAEQCDGLPELLLELAEFARADRVLVDRCREAIAYPCFVIFFAMAVFWFVFCFVVPRFALAFYDFSDGDALPAITQQLLAASDLLIKGGTPLAIAYVLLAALVLWSFGRGRGAYALCYGVLRRMPGTTTVMRETDYTRLCRLWQLYLRRGLPLVEAIPHSRHLLGKGPLNRNLLSWEHAAQQGRDLPEALRSSGADGLLAMTLSSGNEGHWDSLAEMYDTRAESAKHRLVTLWSLVGAIAMGLTTLWVAVAMFSPLIQMIELLRLLP
jgi:type II secretory pathway component PulF